MITLFYGAPVVHATADMASTEVLCGSSMAESHTTEPHEVSCVECMIELRLTAAKYVEAMDTYASDVTTELAGRAETMALDEGLLPADYDFYNDDHRAIVEAVTRRLIREFVQKLATNNQMEVVVK